MSRTDRKTAREALLKKLEGIQDGWTAARVYADGMRLLNAPEEPELTVTARRSRGAPAPLAKVSGFNNPGAVYDSPSEAAFEVTAEMNPRSVAANTEFVWTYYRDPATGKYGYTDPYDAGKTGGGALPLPISSNGARLPKAWTVGMGHTHGDYSDVSGQRTIRRNDRFDSDRFSDKHGDVAYMRRRGPDGTWTYFSLGTPSGRFLQYDPNLGVMPMITPAAPKLFPVRKPPEVTFVSPTLEMDSQ